MKKEVNLFLIKIRAIFYVRFILMNIVPVFLLIVLLDYKLNYVGILFVVALIFYLIFNLRISIEKINNYKKFKKIIRENVDEVIYELKNSFYVNFYEYILSENYIVDLRSYKIIKYENVKIMYYCKKKSLTSTDSPLALTLITNKDKVSLNLWSCFFHFNEYYENLENLIKDKNPNVIKCKKRDIKKKM